ARVGRLAWRTSLSTGGARRSSSHRRSRSSNSGTKGCRRWAPMRPLACQRVAAAAATSAPYCRGRPVRTGGGVLRGGPQQADDRLAVDAGDGDDLVQELALLPSGGLLVQLSLSRGILSQAGSGHGALLAWIGNRDF